MSRRHLASRRDRIPRCQPRLTRRASLERRVAARGRARAARGRARRLSKHRADDGLALRSEQRRREYVGRGWPTCSWWSCTWQVISRCRAPREIPGSGSPTCRSRHAVLNAATRSTPDPDRIVVQRIRGPRPRRRTRHRRRNRLVLRTQRSRRPRLHPPLARSPEPRRHHHYQLEPGDAGRRAMRRIPMPGRLDRRQTSRPRTRHAIGALVAHGRSD